MGRKVAALLGWSLASIALGLGGRAVAQQESKALAECPYCHDDPKLLAQLNLVRHGNMPFGPQDSNALAGGAPSGLWWFLESEHFRIGFGLSGCPVEAARSAFVTAELAKLKAVLPTVPKQARKLDAPLRVHLLTQRLEETYQRIQRAFGVRDSDFPESRPLTGPYMGDGRFLGERDKFEFVIFPNTALHKDWTRAFSGASVTDTLRWHFSPQHKLHASVSGEHADLRSDLGLQTHLTHNLAHMMLCAYKHYSYDPPIWIDEGLAIYFEKELDPRATTIEGEEGGSRSVQPPKDFEAAAKALALQDSGPRLALMMTYRDYSELSADELVSCWAIAKFLIEAHPEGCARFLGGIKGQLDEEGRPSGKDLGGLQRRLLKEIWGWSPGDLDREWRAWLVANRRK
jgi:hypothetical protein